MSTGHNLAVLRDHNAAAVLSLVRAGSVSQIELAAATGLTVQAISKIVQRLQGDGLVAEAGRSASTGGKPRTLLRLVPDARHALGVHVSRESMTLLLTDLTGRPVDRARLPLPEEPGRALDLLAAEAHRIGAKVDHVLGAGLAFPGPLDARTGVLGGVTGLPRWHGYPLRAEAEGRLNLPVVVEKDTTAAVLSHSGAADRAFVYLADGLGAGLCLAGRPHRGAHTNAGEFGHQIIDPAGPLCARGDRGCVEALVLTALREGDTAAAAAHLAVAVGNLVGLLDLEEIVLGGHTLLADPAPYLKAIQAPKITLATADAVPLGAAALVLSRLFG